MIWLPSVANSTTQTCVAAADAHLLASINDPNGHEWGLIVMTPLGEIRRV